MRFDWLLSGALIAATAVAFAWWTRLVSSRLATRWLRFQSRPFWFRALVYSGLIWVGLRLLRGGLRPFIGYVLVVGGIVLWAAASAHAKRT
jgi:hypothetical protein